MVKKIIAFVFFLALIPTLALAHQPRIASGVEVQVIENPEISKAYYGDLTGNSQFFQINAEKEFKFYINLLVPDLPSIHQDVSAEIYAGDTSQMPIYVLDGKNFTWQRFFEEYGGDYYLKGPEYTAPFQPGTYTIKVFSPDNKGKYVLAIGEKESFTFKEILNTIVLLPQIKSSFFGKPPIMALYNVFGKWLLIGFGALILIIIVIVILVKKFSRPKIKKYGKR